MFDPLITVVIAVTFFMAGTVKGVIGLGLPTVSLGLLAVALDLPTAMALLIVPSLVTNLWQAASGGHGRAAFVRLWPFLLMATATIWLGAGALTRVDLSLLTGFLGVLLIGYGALDLAGVRLVISPRRELWAGPLFGAVNGILTGMTGTFVVPGVMYLQAMAMPRDMLVQAMGMLFTASTLALALALQGNGFLTADLGLASAAAVIPAAIGMAAGQRLRRRLSEARFRHIFFVALIVLGAYLVANAVLGLG
jgi:uncharacterized membrane protein YfcA